jgi:hypothetical protein
MLPSAPPSIVWERRATGFLDQLVEADIDYINVQIALEHLIDAGLHDEAHSRSTTA